MDLKNYLDKTGLAQVWGKMSDIFVRKEHKTGSDSQYKVLSDNNLTDELLDKINNAGDSSFGGSYNQLTNKPSIEGHELQGGNQSAESLGLATPATVTGATADMATKTWVQGLGYQSEQNVQDAIQNATSDMATKTYVESKGYQTSEQVQQAVTSGTAGMATQTWVEGRNYQTGAEVTEAINSAVASTYTAKGSVAFADLPELTSAKVGDVYNVTDGFTTDANFVEGAGNEYQAGTNVVAVNDSDNKKWDVLSGFVDLDGYVQDSDLQPIDSTYIEETCI